MNPDLPAESTEIRGAAASRRGRNGGAWPRLLPILALAAVAGTPWLLGFDDQPDDIAALRAAYAGPPESWPPARVDGGVDAVELGLLPDPVHPADNPYNDAKEALGEMLFFDPRLSGSGQMACASCHEPDLGWADGRVISFGHDRTPLQRNAPTAQNTGHLPILFWDGRAASLEDVVRDVVAHPDEFRSGEELVAERIADVPGYAEHFEAAFGDPEADLDRVADAIACFIRELNGGRSRFDAFLRGRDAALSDAAVRGLHLFRTDARCMNCHHGPLLSDGKLHNTGLALLSTPSADPGAYAVTGDPEHVGAFRTPTLRNLPRTRPFMHHGLFDSLDVVVKSYNIGNPTLREKKGGWTDADGNPLPGQTKSPLLHRLDLEDHQLDDLKAFLTSLEEAHRRIEPPDLPE